MSKLIPLTKGYFAIVDDDDYEKLNCHKWYAKSIRHSHIVYASRDIGSIHEMMHRVIMGNPDGVSIDHINGNSIDNRKENLRICTHSQNLSNRSKMNTKNTSGYKGVGWSKNARKWSASITHNYKKIHLGYFFDIIDAAKARDVAALKYHGEFASLNFPDNDIDTL